MRLGRIHLFVAFAFTVMADPVSSVAYAIEAAQRALGGDPASLVATMTVVVAIIVVVAITYHQLIGRFPEGGGGPEAVGAAFGEGWAFLPLGALLVDFTLTVAVSCAAAAAALIAYAPGLETARLPLALAIAGLVALGVLAGHRGRIGFALAVQAFLVTAAGVVVAALFADPGPGGRRGGRWTRRPALRRRRLRGPASARRRRVLLPRRRGGGGTEQELVKFYAVSVFASFLAATLACARLNLRDGRRPAAALNLLGAAAVVVVLGLNLTRLDSAIALLASAAIALYLWRAWVARGRPRGVSRAPAPPSARSA